MPVITLLLALLQGSAERAGAQSQNRLAIRVQAVDTLGAPVSGVNVVILTVRRDTLGRGTTTDDGRALIAIDSGAGDRQVVARKIGFRRNDQFVRIHAAETLLVSIRLQRPQPTLPLVTVTERRRGVPYNFISADEIDSMSLHRTIYEARDIVLKLRPDMVNASHCPPRPPPLSVWVNGKRMFGPGMPMDSVLAQIHAEHVSEIRYENCQSSRIRGNGGRNAIFVSLKPGIAFDLKYGSFIVDRDSMLRAINRKP